MAERNRTFLIYGANGYTGQLITHLAVKEGLKPILAGRNEKAIKAMAKKYDLPYEIVDLTDKEGLNDAVLLANVVLHGAGPFSPTYKPMLEACIKNGTHYLDITGEIEVFEKVAARDIRIKDAGIMAMPGTGFDVVPTDCLAAYLKSQLPTATHLELAFLGIGGISHGTATTMLENLGRGGAIRKDGVITKVPNAYKVKPITYSKTPILSATIPWGDVSTAYHSTGIRNIEVYTAMNKWMLRVLQSKGLSKWFLHSNFMTNIMQKIVDKRSPGPSAAQRSKGKSFVWGKVYDEKGNVAVARLTTPEGYTLTALTAIEITKRVLNDDYCVGFQTPSSAYGADFILEIKGTKREDIVQKREIDVS